MKYQVHFYRPEDGKRAVTDEVWSGDTFTEEDKETLEFMWSEGNFGCDCNRGDWMARELGEPDPNYPCGGEKIVVEKIELEDGTVIYRGDNG